jgi:hypothetical protein
LFSSQTVRTEVTSSERLFDSPLYDRTRDQVQISFAYESILKPPDFCRPFSLSVDTRNDGMGSVFLQLYDDMKHPVYLFSNGLKEHLVRYCNMLEIGRLFKIGWRYTCSHDLSVRGVHVGVF